MVVLRLRLLHLVLVVPLALLLLLLLVELLLVVVLVVVLVVLVLAVELVAGAGLVLVAAALGADVSLELLWPKLAASFWLISATAPFSADLTLTSRTRPSWLAVGVDLITRRNTRSGCSPEAEQTRANANRLAKLM